MQYVMPILKAIVGAVIAALSALGAYLVDDTSLGEITAGQWVFVVLAFFTALAAVWGVPWMPKKDTG